MPEECRRIRVTGHVQGVAYRAWTKGQADKLGLTGWVLNEGDGAVSALICGRREDVEAMETAFWQGPAAADVRDVQSTKVPPESADSFEIRR